MKRIGQWIGIGIGCAILYYVSVLYNSLGLLFLASMIGLISIVSNSLLHYIRNALSCSLKLDQYQCTLGKSASVTGELENKSLLPTGLIMANIEFQLNGSNIVEQEAVFLRVSGKNKKAIDVMCVLPHCGVWTVNMTEIRLFGWLSLFQLPVKWENASKILYVYPDYHLQPVGEIPNVSGEEDSEEIDARPYSLTNEHYIGVRSYQPGDSLRSIHWKMTARMGELSVRQYADGTNPHAIILVDTYYISSMNFEQRDCLFEELMGFSASLLHNKNPHTVAVVLADQGIQSENQLEFQSFFVQSEAGMYEYMRKIYEQLAQINEEKLSTTGPIELQNSQQKVYYAYRKKHTEWLDVPMFYLTTMLK